MKEIFEGLGAIVATTGGTILLVIPALFPLLVVYFVLQSVGQNLSSSHTRRQRITRARKILARLRFPGDKFYREIAETTLRSEGVKF